MLAVRLDTAIRFASVGGGFQKPSPFIRPRVLACLVALVDVLLWVLAPVFCNIPLLFRLSLCR